jgi:hypothetical protein
MKETIEKWRRLLTPERRRRMFIEQYLRTSKADPTLGLTRVLSTAEEKIGSRKEVLGFSLPLGSTCCADDRIASPTCRSVCYCFQQYADRGDLLIPLQRKNFALASHPDFDLFMIGAILHSGVSFFKLHIFGDFFDAEYIKSWIRIIRECEHVTFWCYTRAWRVAEWVPYLTEMAAIGNMNLCLSFDGDTGIPPPIPRTKLAWLARHDVNAPPASASPRTVVAFRSSIERVRVNGKNARPRLVKLGGVTVCPHQNGAEDVDLGACVECRICLFNNEREQV